MSTAREIQTEAMRAVIFSENNPATQLVTVWTGVESYKLSAGVSTRAVLQERSIEKETDDNSEEDFRSGDILINRADVPQLYGNERGTFGYVEDEEGTMWQLRRLRGSNPAMHRVGIEIITTRARGRLRKQR